MKPSLMFLPLLLACSQDEGVKVYNTAPGVSLVAPAPDSRFDEGDLVEFEAIVEDSQDDPSDIRLSWSSDLDGILEEGVSPDSGGLASWSSANLVPGTHAIRLTAVDSEGASGSDTLTIDIIGQEATPTLTILTPELGEFGVEGEPVLLSAEVFDHQDEPASLIVRIESDLDGPLCEPVPDAEGYAWCEEALSLGRHQLSYEVEDRDGNLARATATFEVYSLDDLDGDGDGFTPSGGDCDDANDTVFPGAPEECDGEDDDCDGLVDEGTECYDDDGDGYTELDGDCNDANAAVFPGGFEYLDGIDNDCDGAVDDGTEAFDDDGDCACEVEPCAGSIGSCKELIGEDCDDADSDVFPEATERCNGADDDCDGTIDEPDAEGAPLWYADADEDGFGDPAVSTPSCELPTGYVADSTDCDDGNGAIHPAASETCNGVDDNCDGNVDEGVLSSFFLDSDGDGYGDPALVAEACIAPTGYVADATDCDDGSADISPSAPEQCNSIDDDCDGTIDEEDASDALIWYTDADGDGYGNPALSTEACAAPTGTVADATDCNDGNNTVHPGAPEICDSIDQDCDGTVDEETTCYDDDGDGYTEADGDCDDADAYTFPGAPELGDGLDNDCDGAVDEGTSIFDDDGDGFSEADGDCDDGESDVFPGNPEVCDGLDNDCDGTVDEGTECYDDDGDGDTEDEGDCDDADSTVYPGAPELVDGLDNDCDGPIDEGTTAYDDDGDCFCEIAPCMGSTSGACGTVDGGDCDDGQPAFHPDATELCNLFDDDCDGTVDEDSADDAPTWYLDADGDGVGDGAVSTRACSSPGGYVASSGDCNDADASAYPGAPEVCDGVDDDCDGSVDDGVLHTYYEDADGDSYGAAASTVEACSPPGGYVSDNTDCDDSDATINPDTLWYLDADGDGYGDPSVSTRQCTRPSAHVDNASDCNDGTASAYPGRSEECDGLDNDCDGSIDESGASGCSTHYVDNDGDGYGATSSGSACTCGPVDPYVETSNNDCYDYNADAYPGQSAWFTGQRGDGSYDFDCDGAETKENTAVGGCHVEISWSSVCDEDPAGWSGSAPSCGSTADWIWDCHFVLLDCEPDYESRTMACR